MIPTVQVSAGEEGIGVGSAAALTADDTVFAQYREAGVCQQRGFTIKDFESLGNHGQRILCTACNVSMNESAMIRSLLTVLCSGSC